MNRLNKTVRIDPRFSWTDWELYETDGHVRAAELLNKLLADLVNAGCDRGEVYSAMHSTMTSGVFADVGAADSEALAFLERVLSEIYD